MPDQTETGTVDLEEPAHLEESANVEAARYRVRLREAEAQRDAVTATLSTLRQSHLDGHVTRGVQVDGRMRRLTDPGDLALIGGLAVDDAYAEDGTLDPDAVTAALSALYATRPGLFEEVRPARNIGPYVPDEGRFPARPLRHDRLEDVLGQRLG